MENLYRKIGDNEFEEVCQSFYGNPDEGVWLIKRDNGCLYRTWLCEKLEDAPEKMSYASFRTHEVDVLKGIMSRLNRCFKKWEVGEQDYVTPQELAKILRSVIK